MKKATSLKQHLFAIFCLISSISSASAAALTVNPVMPITDVVNIQPIIVSDNNGTNTADFFGNSGQQIAIEGFIDQIWAQAGIDINFLSANNWSNSFANNGTGAPTDVRATSDINSVISNGYTAGVASTVPNVINMYLVNIAPGFSLLSNYSAAGLAFVNGNGITQYVGSSLLNFTDGQEVIASVVAHEIGHNLGLNHILETENLMNSSSSGQRLNSNQIATALNSRFSVTAVPVPPALILFLSGLGCLGFYKRKRT